MKIDSSDSLRRVSSSDLERLISTLEVNFVGLSQCSVSRGYRLELGGAHAPGIHYNLFGHGKVYIGNKPAMELKPHTLIIVPKNCTFRIEVADEAARSSALKVIDGSKQTAMHDGVRRFTAGEQEEADVILICGFFNASYGSSTDLFANLSGPIIEQFDIADHIDAKLQAAMSELISQEIGSKAMSSALLKQVIVSILRRSLSSLELWTERFAILSDSRIAKAFSEMVAEPGAPHTVLSLAETACMSRSAFMSRFSELFDKSPMTVLRELRMRQAAQQLKSSNFSVDQIAHLAGYESKGSFIRAFHKIYENDPSTYRTAG